MHRPARSLPRPDQRGLGLRQPRRACTYRLGTDELIVDTKGNSTISMEDLAAALLDEAEQPKHHPNQVHCRVLIPESAAQPVANADTRAGSSQRGCRPQG